MKSSTPLHRHADPQLKDAMSSQRSIGWKSFMEGLVCWSIIDYQKQYLKTHFPTTRITRWTTNLIKNSWNLIMAIWTYRNETLHKTKNIEALQGSEVLEEVIKKEWEVGLSKLPIHEFTHLFWLKKEELLAKSTQSKKDWLLTVKLGRELHKDGTAEEDKFDTNGELRNWIGLPKKAMTPVHHQIKKKTKKKRRRRKKK